MGCACMQALGSTLLQVRNRPVDVVLFLSRLDEFRVDASDVQASATLILSALHLGWTSQNISQMYFCYVKS